MASLSKSVIEEPEHHGGGGHKSTIIHYYLIIPGILNRPVGVSKVSLLEKIAQ